MKVRERSPANLDSALRITLQLEVWTKDVDRIRNEQSKHFERKVREVTQTESLVKMNEELRKQVSELQDQLARVTFRLKAYDSVGRPAAEHHVAEGSRSSMKPRPKDFACWGCGSRGNSARQTHAILFDCVRIRRLKREDITIRGKFGMSGKSELEIAQEVDTKKTPKRKSTQHRRRLEPKT